MSDIEDPSPDTAYGGGLANEARGDETAADASESTLIVADGAVDRHIAVAVPIRAVERNRRVASSVLAGGFAYLHLPVAAAARPRARRRARSQQRGQHRGRRREGWTPWRDHQRGGRRRAFG